MNNSLICLFVIFKNMCSKVVVSKKCQVNKYFNTFNKGTLIVNYWFFKEKILPLNQKKNIYFFAFFNTFNPFSWFFSCFTQVFFVGQGLNDDQWHTMHITRRGQSMDVKVDSEATSRGTYSFLFLFTKIHHNLVFKMFIILYYKLRRLPISL